MEPATNTQPQPKSYNPHDHLIKIRTKEGLKDYYPAAWRLYELNLRYENANFQSEILSLDVERNLVVVKCRLYLGADYESSPRKTEAMKSGPLSQLDKVETAAKARCARDFGCGTEYALELASEVEEEAEIVLAERSGQAEHVARVVSHDGTRPLPTLTVQSVHIFFLKTYQVSAADSATRWRKFKVYVLKTEIADRDLSAEQLRELNGVISQEWQRQHATSEQGAA